MNQEHSESVSVTMIWASDGWCYVPQLKMRCKFRTDNSIQEPWDGVIAMPEHVEETTWSSFQSKFSTTDTQKKRLSRPRKPQPPQQP